MKKLLALVLALVMTLSLAVVGSNAAFKDADKVSDTYAEAVDVLAGMKVFQGYTDGSFQPEGSITRAEVAAIVYRLYTGDVTDKQASLYATYNKFTDMNGAAWAAGYIGYCANAGLVKGYDAKTFGPSDKVTGYQALAMILRAVGYDKNDEFTGSQWQLHVAQYAQQLGILKNVKDEDLNAAASRQLVAELLFRTAAYVPTVTYTAALGYTNLNALINGQKNDTLGYKNFGLTKAASSADKWGRPYYTWFNDVNGDKVQQATEATYATVKATPAVKYTTKVTECDIANDLGLKANETMAVYDNGAVAASWTIRPLATTATKGAQGEQVEIYELSDGSYRVVVIDTYLAKVIKNSDLTYDNAGHVRTYATIDLAVYSSKVSAEAAAKNLTLTSSTANFGYVAGDYVLVNVNATAAKSDILGKAESIEGSQTIIYTNADKHTVNGTDYNDAVKFNLDMAQKDGKMKYTWFFDQFGNLIGDKVIANVYSYGTITSMWWAEDASTGGGKAMATVVYMDGTPETVELNTVDSRAITYSIASTGTGSPMYMDAATTGYLYLAPYASTNYAADALTNNADLLAGTVGTAKDGHLFRFFKNETTGKVDAVKVTNPATLNMVDQTVATVTPKVSFIAGSIRTNDSTVYLIQKVGATATAAKTYETVTGYSNIPALQNVTADAIDLDGDGYADYVYLTGDAANQKTSGLFYVSSVSYSYDSATGIYSVYGYVDGVADKYIQVSDVTGSDNWDNTTSGGNIKAALTADTLYVVKYVDGMAVAISPVGTTASTIATVATADYNKSYTVADYDKYSVVKTNGGGITANDYVDAAGNHYFVGGATCVLPNTGFKADMSEQTVYLVFNTVDKSVVSAYIIDQDNCTVAVAAEANATGYVTVWGETAHVTKVASGTKVAFCITPAAGYEVTGYTVNGVAGNVSDIVTAGSLSYVGLTVTGDTTVDFVVAKKDTSATLPTTLSATAGGSTLDTSVKGYATLAEAVANAKPSHLTGAASIEVAVSDSANNTVAAQIYTSAPTSFSSSQATVSGNVNTGSYIVIAVTVSGTTYYAAYTVA